MPAGVVTAITLASATVSGAPAALTFYTNVLSATNLVAGTNFLAVEVHQSSTTSSDIGWEMEVSGLPLPPPRLGLARLGTDVVLYWSDVTFGLEEASDVTGPWTIVPNGSTPTAVLPVNGQRFYRLRR